MRARFIFVCALVVLHLLALFSTARAQSPCTLLSPGGYPDPSWGFDREYGGLFGITGKHQAQDFIKEAGVYKPFPVSFVANGRITRHETDNTGSGGVVDIAVDSCPGLKVQYVHLRGSTIDHLRVGQQVRAGEKLGVADGSGTLSGGPHLHLKVILNGVPVDPLDYINSQVQPQPDPIPNLWIVPLVVPLLLVAILRPRLAIKATVWGVYWGAQITGHTIIKIFRNAGCSVLILATSVFVVALMNLGFSPSLPKLPPQGGTSVNAKISHYWPPFGGTNCGRWDPVKKKCLSRMASGLKWEDWVDKAVACPTEYPFWTRFYAFDKEWICLDRGGAIVTNPDGTIWLDFLTKKAPVPFGTVVEVIVLPPDGN